MFPMCNHFSNNSPSETVYVYLCDMVYTQYWQYHTKFIEVLDF